jgi:hypothetical protein
VLGMRSAGWNAVEAGWISGRCLDPLVAWCRTVGSYVYMYIRKRIFMLQTLLSSPVSVFFLESIRAISLNCC